MQHFSTECVILWICKFFSCAGVRHKGHVRKRKQVENVPKKGREAKLIKLADKTSNVRAVTSSSAPDWSVKRRLEYVEWARSVVAGIRGTSPWLEQQFDDAADQAVRSLNPQMAIGGT
jgi:guanosine-3',5'-bis(diphosphate) 3'-pyrophosphohydrolase